MEKNFESKCFCKLTNKNIYYVVALQAHLMLFKLVPTKSSHTWFNASSAQGNED